MTLLSRLAYRSRQFRLAFLGPWHPIPDEALTPHLSPALLALFRRMTPSEQAHSFAVLQRLIPTGDRVNPHSDHDLFTAALLHDVGKVISPLSLLDRILIVLAKRFFARRFTRWGQGKSVGLRRPFVVAAQHPAWGADLAAAAGASPGAYDLIRHHQDPSPGSDPLLLALQSADDAL